MPALSCSDRDECRRAIVRTALHEAGHVVAGHELGLTPTAATIASTDRNNGSVRFQDELTGLTGAITLLAGPMAALIVGSVSDRRRPTIPPDAELFTVPESELAREAAERYEPRPDRREERIGSDWQRAQALANGNLVIAREAAEVLLARRWGRVVAVAEELLEEGTIGRSEIGQLFDPSGAPYSAVPQFQVAW